jgi:hypothetical protein
MHRALRQAPSCSSLHSNNNPESGQKLLGREDSFRPVLRHRYIRGRWRAIDSAFHSLHAHVSQPAGKGGLNTRSARHVSHVLGRAPGRSPMTAESPAREPTQFVDPSGCEQNGYRPIWLLHGADRPSSIGRSGCHSAGEVDQDLKKPESISKPALRTYESWLLVLIWLYIAHSCDGMLMALFRIGVLHLVARTANIERFGAKVKLHRNTLRREAKAAEHDC